VREGERDDVLRTGFFKSINSGLKRSTGCYDIIDDYVGTCEIGRVRGAKGTAHIFFAFISWKRDL